jgi:hypothetical protein
MAQAFSRWPFNAEALFRSHVGFVVDKEALGQAFPRVLRFLSVSFIPPFLHYTEKIKMSYESCPQLWSQPLLLSVPVVLPNLQEEVEQKLRL